MSEVSPKEVETWLYDYALPLWQKNGIDPSGHGAWEALDHEGSPLTARDKRIRVHPRQAYVFAKAARHGHTKYLDTAEQLYKYAISAGIDPESGHLISLTHPDGQTSGEATELYDIAFLFLAGAALTEAGRPQDTALDQVWSLCQTLRRNDGFANNAKDSQPLAQNPNMHLFEAMTELTAATGKTRWRDLAQELRDRFANSFLRADGAVLEFFGPGWNPVEQGQKVEAGHILEWVWLLDQHATVTGAAISTDLPQMFQTAQKSLNMLGLITDTQEPPSTTARLWPQCEALKAAIVMERRGHEIPGMLRPQIIVNRMFRIYFDTPVLGGWYDKIDAEGRVISSDMPSSSLYHIYVALRAYLDHVS